MFSFMLGNIVCSMLLANVGTASAQTSLDQVRADLQAVADNLTWKGTTYATYGPILETARKAYSAVASISGEDSNLHSQAAVVSQGLERLIAESQYFVQLSEDPNYENGVLDSIPYLTASVDEWHHAVTVLGSILDKPYCPEPSGLASSKAENISSVTEPGTEFRDNELTPTMVVIPTGSYTAGATQEEHDRWRVPEPRRPFEVPQRQVSITKPLAFSRTEVTVAEYDTFIRQTCYQPRGGARWWTPETIEEMGFNPELTYLNPGFPQTPDHPVVTVTRNDAQAYARWLSAITGATYRLPTEDEWEWAARGGSQHIFFWGDELIPDVVSYANCYDTTAGEANHFRWPPINVTDGFPYTAPVASFKPNGFGLYDVTANAREFMADDWVENLSTAAANGTIHKGPAPFPVVRGGAWNYNPRNLRLNYRSAYFSSEVATNMFGIRLVREL